MRNKHIYKVQNWVFCRLRRLGIYDSIPDEKYIRKLYKFRMQKELNLDNPKTFSEKLQWLKLYDRNLTYTKLVDKYEVKKYIAETIGEEYVIPTLGVYEKFEDIEFEKLPEQFVIKCTHDSGGLVIVKDKSKLDYKKAKKKINNSLKRNYYWNGREWPYKNVKPRILIERYMANDKQQELIDYKFFCFNGEAKFLYISEGLSNHATAKISFADMDYNMMKFYRNDYTPFTELPPKPINFEKMKELAKKLSENIPFVRIDFYEIDRKIYFGEITFFPCSGFIPIYPERYDKILGEYIELPDKKVI